MRTLVTKAAALALTGATAVTGLLVAEGAPAAQAAAKTTRTPVCVPAMVRIVDAGSSGAAGTTYHLLRFTNVTQISCVMRGYPGVSFSDIGGHRIGVPATREAVVPVTSVLLQPGRSAHTAVGIPNPANFPPSLCRARRSSYVRVYPPGSYTSRLVTLRASVCTTAFGAAHVQAVAAGAGRV